MATTDLKHLGFVKTYGTAGVEAVANSKTYAKAVQLYAGAKESGALKNSLEVLEGLVKTYATPLANKAAAAAPHALAAADAKVDASLAYASTVYTDKVLPSTPVQTALALKTALAERQSVNLAAFVQARAEYFSLIEAHVEALKAKGVTLSHDASAALATAIADARARATTEAHAALGKVSAAWDAFVATPSVASAMEAATPAVQAARAKAHAALAYVLSTPQYQTYVAPRVDYVASQPRVQAVVGKIRPLVAAF